MLLRVLLQVLLALALSPLLEAEELSAAAYSRALPSCATAVSTTSRSPLSSAAAYYRALPSCATAVS
eukprot:COSAG01_NODE_58962_length_303_cov_0.504902_1_plen_66_part_10